MAKRPRSNSNAKTAKKGRMIKYVSPSDLIVPGYTQNKGVYGRFNQKRCCSGPELKWLDEEGLYAITGLTGAKSVLAQSFNVVEQGTGPSQRIGQKIVVKSIGVNFSMWMPAGSLAPNIVQSHLLRIILVCDKQNNGVGFTTPDVLYDVTDPLDPSAQSFRNLTNSGRFNVLSDTRYNLNYTGVAGDAVVTNVVHCAQTLVSAQIWKDVNIPIEFSGTGSGALPNIRSNNIAALFVLESRPILGTGGVSIFLQSRIRYED